MRGLLVSKSCEYTTVSEPPNTSLTSKLTSTLPEFIAFSPVFLTVTLTHRLPSPSIALPVEGSTEEGSIVTPVSPKSKLSKVKTDR